MRGSEFWAGYDACHQGQQRDACPYPAGTPAADNWLDGWGSDAASIMEALADDARLGPLALRGQSHETVMDQ